MSNEGKDWIRATQKEASFKLVAPLVQKYTLNQLRKGDKLHTFFLSSWFDRLDHVMMLVIVTDEIV